MADLVNVPRGAARLAGRVIDPAGAPVPGVAVSVAGRTAGRTNARGEFTVAATAAAERLAVSFTAPGFIETTQIVDRTASGSINTVVVWPRAQAAPLNAARGGTLRFPAEGNIEYLMHATYA